MRVERTMFSQRLVLSDRHGIYQNPSGYLSEYTVGKRTLERIGTQDTASRFINQYTSKR